VIEFVAAIAAWATDGRASAPLADLSPIPVCGHRAAGAAKGSHRFILALKTGSRKNSFAFNISPPTLPSAVRQKLISLILSSTIDKSRKRFARFTREGQN